MQDITAASIVKFTSRHVVILLNHSALLSAVYKDGQVTSSSVVCLPETTDRFNTYSIKSDMCVLLDSNDVKLLLYSLPDGKLVTEYDLTQLYLDVHGIQKWDICSDLSTLVVVLHNGNIQLIDLQVYCMRLPNCVKQHGHYVSVNNQPLKIYLNTCHYGDLAFRNKLINLHQDHLHQSSTTVSVKVAGSNFGNADRNQHKMQLTGFWSKKPRPVRFEPDVVQTINVPSCVQGFSMEDMEVNSALLSLVFQYHDHYVLCQWNFQTKQWMQYNLNAEERIILTRMASLPQVIITNNTIMDILTNPGMSQEHFVSELMIYAGAPLAEAVCHLNNWGRCSIPLHTLEVGLKYRQIDTVTFFLNSKEQYFSSISHVPNQQQDEYPPHLNHSGNLSDLEPAINLLLQSIKDSMGDRQSQIFGKHVLGITMEFLYSLLVDSLLVSENATAAAEKLDVQQVTDKLLKYIDETRLLITQMEHVSRSVSHSESMAVRSLSTTSSTVLSIDSDIPDTGNSHPEWEDMNLEMIVEDGIMNNIVPEMQQYLLQRDSKMASYCKVKSIAISLAINYIKCGLPSRAKQLLTKFGLEVTKELWEIALNTLDMGMCNSIIEELSTNSLLSKQQVVMTSFLKELNELYPSRNFERSHIQKESDQHESERLQRLFNQNVQYNLRELCGNLNTELCSTKDSAENLYYNEVMLNWIQTWENKTMDLIKLDVLLHRPGSNIISYNKQVLWEYFLSRNLNDIILSWIQMSFLGNTPEDCDKESHWPVSHLGAVLSEFVNDTNLCTSLIKARIIKTFARYGIFTLDAMGSFESILKILKSVGGPLITPHPLRQCTAMTVQQFHESMIQYCIAQNIPYFLWIYCTVFRLQRDIVESIADVTEQDSWLHLFMNFLTVSCNHGNLKPAVFESGLTNAVYIWGSNVSTIGDLLKSGHVLAALAVLMFSSHRLQEITFVTQQLEAFDGMSSESVEQAIKAYPKLHVTLFPASVAESPQADVSVYHLLMGNAPFDTKKLFGWQSTNTFVGEDAMKDMPYFSNAALVAKYGFCESLKYSFYLKQGRPSFAFIAFLAEEFKTGGSNITPKRLAVAKGTSLWIGVKYFYNPQIASSCVLFQELLGQDSLLLRTYIHVGNEILTYLLNSVTGTMEKRREHMKKNELEAVELLLDSVQGGKQQSLLVLQRLEAAILAGITKDKLPVWSFEAGQCWILAVLFCDCLHLPYSTTFLESCAQTNHWLPFVWFSQMNQYPKEQLQSLLHHFKSVQLQEHLQYILVNAALRSNQANEKKRDIQMKSDMVAKDMRSTLYSKIGVLKETNSDLCSTSEEDSPPATTTDPADTEDTDNDAEFSITVDSSPSDIFGVIFAAQTSKYPWKALLVYAITLKNCIFAELAVSLQQNSILPCLCSWLVAMMDDTVHDHFLKEHGKLPWRYNIQTLNAILVVYVKHKWGSLLVTGFHIFQQNSPLLPFLHFYMEFTEKQNYNNCRLHLWAFKDVMCKFQQEKSESMKKDIVGDASWLDQTTFYVIQYVLCDTPSVYQVAQFVNLLHTEGLAKISNTDRNYFKQSQLLQILVNAEIHEVNLSRLLIQTGVEYEKECMSVIDKLINKELFDEARKFAKIAGISADHVTTQQVTRQKEKISKSDLWFYKHARLKFYNECSDIFRKNAVQLEYIAEFFQNEVNETDCCVEKANLYAMCLQCMSGCSDKTGHEQVEPEIYCKMWENRIQAKMDVLEGHVLQESTDYMFKDFVSLQQTSKASSKAELMYCGKMPRKSQTIEKLTDKELLKSKAIQQIIGEILRNGQVIEACRLATEFNLYSQDLAIVLTCIRLSLGEASLDTLSPEMMVLIQTKSGHTHRQSIAAPVALLRNSSTISLISNIQPTIESMSAENEANIAAMECLLNHCENSRHMCVRILTAFKIASVLCIGYTDVIMGNDYNILQSLLNTNCPAKFRLAADFLGTSSLSANEVAGFLSDSIIKSNKVSLGEIAKHQEVLFDLEENLADFHQVVRLCTDPSLLGNRLIDTVAAMSGDTEQTSDKALTLQTELLILSHECYTAACDMEGISNVLCVARILTAQLQAANEFQLMTQLLIGVGRFNEMTYIFDSLQQNHQFELLLGKGIEIDKNTKLKTSILDYLKRYHPGDTDTYTMVALKFMMYREIAQLLEDNAKKILNNFKGKQLENNSDTQATLQKVVQFLSEAAERYIKENCIRHAQACIRKARLVALQIKHLSTNLQVINLTSKGAALLITDHAVFSEAYIISEAYEQRNHWSTALCNNVIIRGDVRYLQEFRSSIRITSQLVEDAVERYQHSADKPLQALPNIKKLLQFCTDVKVHYYIAKQLGLREVVTMLEKGDSKSYIMDFSTVMSQVV